MSITKKRREMKEETRRRMGQGENEGDKMKKHIRAENEQKRKGQQNGFKKALEE